MSTITEIKVNDTGSIARQTINNNLKALNNDKVERSVLLDSSNKLKKELIPEIDYVKLSDKDKPNGVLALNDQGLVPMSKLEAVPNSNYGLLYGGSGQNTDAPMHQKAVTDGLNLKLNKLEFENLRNEFNGLQDYVSRYGEFKYKNYDYRDIVNSDVLCVSDDEDEFDGIYCTIHNNYNYIEAKPIHNNIREMKIIVNNPNNSTEFVFLSGSMPNYYAEERIFNDGGIYVPAHSRVELVIVFFYGEVYFKRSDILYN